MTYAPNLSHADGPLAWQAEARCAELPPLAADLLFFVDWGQSNKAAKEFCAGCPVIDQCREWAVHTNPEFGVFGGTNEHDRRELRRERGLSSERVRPSHFRCGHPRSTENTRITRAGNARCRECGRQRIAAWREKQASAA